MASLRQMIECPVCLVVPRLCGPVPVCSNGHFVCIQCKEALKKAAKADVIAAGFRYMPAPEAKCPSCTVPMGNATSLLAYRLVENIQHECSNRGCGQFVDFQLFEEHLKVCQHRIVLCPGTEGCKLLLPIGQVEEHISSCPAIADTVTPNGSLQVSGIPANKVRNGKTIFWATKVIKFEEKTFFVRRRRLDNNLDFEVVFNGDETEAEGFSACMSLLGINTKRTYMQVTSSPRPISKVSWGYAGLTVPEKDISKYGTVDESGAFRLFLKVSITSW